VFLRGFGTQGTANGQFMFPGAVAVDNQGNVFVADSTNNRIQEFSSQGTFLTKFGEHGSADGQFERPTGIAVDSHGFVYVSDTDNSRIQVFGLGAPAIASATLSGKRLTIEGVGFGNSPAVTINGAEVSTFITASSDTGVTLKAKPKKLNLHAGDNVLLVVGANDVKSAPFILKL